MKLLMFHCREFWYRVGKPGLSNNICPENKEEKYDNCVVIFIHVEPKDLNEQSKLIRKVINNITWYKRKTMAKTVILHSFAHLSAEKADPVKSEKILNLIFEKLRKKITNLYLTPYGCFLEFRMHVFPTPISRVFKDL